VDNNIVQGNYSGSFGGGIACAGSGDAHFIVNNLVIGNTAESSGGGLYRYSDSAYVLNCTFYGNVSNAYGGGIYSTSSNVLVTNCILWNNSALTSGSQIYGVPIVSYSDVEGGFAGTGNINADPMFRDTLRNDFHLTSMSPCIDAGDNDSIIPCSEFDFEGDFRIYPGNGFGYPIGFPAQAVVDMGADEYCLIKRDNIK